MKHKQNNSSSSDAWKKIGIAAVLIVAAFGFLLFLEGEMTGMAPAAQPQSGVTPGPQGNQAPVFQTTKLSDAIVGQKYTATIKVNDKEGDSIDLNVVPPEAGISLKTKAAGIWSFEWSNPTPAGKKKSITLEACSVNGGYKQCTKKTYALMVASDLPSFETKTLPKAVEGKSYSQEIKVISVSGKTIQLSFVAGKIPSPAAKIEGTKFKWLKPVAGTYTLGVDACSVQGAEKSCTSKDFTLVVEKDNAPEFITKGPLNVIDGSKKTTVIEVKEEDKDKVTLSVVSQGAPADLTITPPPAGDSTKLQNFVLSFTPTAQLNFLTLKATSIGKSGVPQSTEQKIMLKHTVDTKPVVGTITVLSPEELAAGKVGKIIEVEDEDGDKVTLTDFSLDLKSKGMGTSKSLAIPATVPYTVKTELVNNLPSKVKITFSYDKTKVTVEQGSMLKAKACSKGVNGKEQCSDISVELWK